MLKNCGYVIYTVIKCIIPGHITPTSSLWEHSNDLGCVFMFSLQSNRLASFPLHPRLSRKMGPDPVPNCVPCTTLAFPTSIEIVYIINYVPCLHNYNNHYNHLLSLERRPSFLHTTSASSMPNPSLHIDPHALFMHISSLP